MVQGITRRLDRAMKSGRAQRVLQLDYGWPESVEEQSLLLLVWKHYIY